MIKNNLQKDRSLQAGQALLEILVVIFIISVTMVGILSLTNQSVSNTDYSRTQTEANRAASDAIEWLRAERDTSWNQFLSRASTSPSGSDWCLNTLSWTIARACNSSEMIANTVLTREVNLSSSGGNRVLAKVSVTWNDESGDHEVYTEYILGDWR